MRRTFLLLALAMWLTSVDGKVVYVATDGHDQASGTISAPLATLPAAYQKIGSGDTICFRGGTYRVTDSLVMKTERNYAFVFALEKGGSASHRTCLMG